ncbi:probable sodium/metabolite cotransporter BASS1, chloroplas [Coccomyxa sp. Obi]|nr:probable sodium/metabolite cotransporter BASS1, chloroplas [Coccomyxa sp. Obi]
MFATSQLRCVGHLRWQTPGRRRHASHPQCQCSGASFSQVLRRSVIASTVLRRSRKGNCARKKRWRIETVARGTAAASQSGAQDSLEKRLGNLATRAANLFPLWLVLGATAALVHPPSLTWFKREYTTQGLALTMMAMGTTLTLDDFAQVVQRPWLVALGATLQYTIMPLMGFAVSQLLKLPLPYAVGICLVASCPGGVASNVVTFLARADVPLSVAMTTVSTLSAVVATPALTQLLVGHLVPVNAGSLLLSTLQVVLVPIALGSFLNWALPRAMARFSPFAPLLASAMTVLVSASIVAQNAAAVRIAGPRLILAVALLHAGGFALGYGVSKLLGVKERQARTNSIEVGMQNSALGAVLATLHFADPLTAIPAAISATMHSLLGSTLAGFWRLVDPEEPNVSLDLNAAAADSMQQRKIAAQQWIQAWRNKQAGA